MAEHNPTTIVNIRGGYLLKIGSCGKWGQGSFIASIANASGNSCGVLGISYRHMDTQQNVTYAFTEGRTIGLSIYKKLNSNDRLEVFIYSTTNSDSFFPMIGLSTNKIENLGNVTDLSSYTLVAAI